jgi:hypothetical protein
MVVPECLEGQDFPLAFDPSGSRTDHRLDVLVGSDWPLGHWGSPIGCNRSQWT